MSLSMNKCSRDLQYPPVNAGAVAAEWCTMMRWWGSLASYDVGGPWY